MKIEDSYIIASSPDKVWEALVDPDLIEKWGAGPAKMTDKKGKFSLWGGEIYGENTKVEKEKTLEQDWFTKDWKEPSKVVINLMKEKNGTRVSLEHNEVPEGSKTAIAQGWKEYYFGPMKELLEG
jgi:activator of HSP90 ATPase